MITVTVNGMPTQVPEGANLLQAVRSAGVDLPTLCYWEGLPAYGACRLCLVQVIEGTAAPKIVAACSHPAEPGAIVTTDAPRAIATRQMMAELLLARCPGSPVVRELAAHLGVAVSRLTPAPPPADAAPGLDDCVLCGLCVRVCRDLVGAAAIGFVGRGEGREVAAPFKVQSEACIGCGACAAVCPTGAVRIETVDGKRALRSWNTVVPLQPCPGCGQPFAPDPMVFLTGLVPVSQEQWGYCPACRRKEAAGRLARG